MRWAWASPSAAGPCCRDRLVSGIPLGGGYPARDAGVNGLAVHAGARFAALAKANEVLVTSTVQMLVLGSGIGFADRGEHILKGIPGRWQLFAVTET